MGKRNYCGTGLLFFHVWWRVGGDEGWSNRGGGGKGVESVWSFVLFVLHVTENSAKSCTHNGGISTNKLGVKIKPVQQ